MPPPFLHMNVLGIAEVEEMLLGGMSAARNMKPALELVADDLFRVVEQNFESQGRRGGGSWAHLDPHTVAQKAREGLDSRILIATEALLDSMTVRGDPAMDLRITNRSLTLESNLPYAHVQDSGGGPSDLPARPYADFTPYDLRRWVRICEDYLIERMGGR
jgi:phage gpG-like protein